MDTATPQKLPSPPVVCVHCRYGLANLTEGKCPECGNPVSDSHDGTRLYRLPSSRLNILIVGVALVIVCSLEVTLTAVYGAVFGIWRGLPLGGFSAVMDAVDRSVYLVYSPWIALFLISTPLDRRKTWASWGRVSALVLVGILSLFYLLSSTDRFTSMSNGVLPSTLFDVIERHLRLISFIPMLLSAIRLQEIAHRLPATPRAWLGPLAIVCSLVLIVQAVLQASGLLLPFPATLIALYALPALLSLPVPVFAWMILGELRAIARDIDAVHPYSKV